MEKDYSQKLFNLKRFFVLEIGIQNAKKIIDEKRIYLVNAICCSLIISYVAVVIIGFFFDKKLIQPLPLIVYSVQLAIITFIFYLQHLGKLFWARLLLVTSMILTCYIVDTFILVDNLIEFYYVISALISLCLFDRKWISILFLVLQIALFFDVFDVSTTIDYSKLHFVILFVIPFALVYLLIEINTNAERLLFKQKQELEELGEFKSHFFVNLSHEIKTPLTLLKGYISRIDFNKPKKENEENLSIVKSQTQQIESIVIDILDLSKVELATYSLDRKKIRIVPFLNNHYSSFKWLFEKKNIEFDLTINNPNIKILCDEKFLSKSLNNLLNNSLKFTPKGGAVSISVTLDLDLKINISDNGIGIPKEDLEKVFNQFYQSKNHITKSKGSGIGLSFTKNIIEAHGFSITVKSTPNIKTEFTITIPEKYVEISKELFKSPPLVEIEEKQIQGAAQIKSTISSSEKSILIVEDHEQMRDYLCKVLSDYKVTESVHGKEALEILEKENFDIIISDYMMPVMDGEAFVKELKQRKIKTPVLVLTARSDNQGKLDMLRLGIDGYLNKPFLEEELLLHIKKALQTSAVIKEFDTSISVKEEKAMNALADTFNRQLNEFVFANIHSSNFGIDDIAGHFDISKSTLNRRVKSLLGQTPKDVVMEARLQKARSLLEENPHETQKNIAQSIGISNTSYFFEKMEERFGKKKFF